MLPYLFSKEERPIDKEALRVAGLSEEEIFRVSGGFFSSWQTWNCTDIGRQRCDISGDKTRDE